MVFGDMPTEYLPRAVGRTKLRVRSRDRMDRNLETENSNGNSDFSRWIRAGGAHAREDLARFLFLVRPERSAVDLLHGNRRRAERPGGVVRAPLRASLLLGRLLPERRAMIYPLIYTRDGAAYCARCIGDDADHPDVGVSGFPWDEKTERFA